MKAGPKQRKARGFGGGVGLQTVRSTLNPKPETRSPKAEKRPKSEVPNPQPSPRSDSPSGQAILGFRVSAFFRPSGFGLRISGLRPDFRAALNASSSNLLWLVATSRPGAQWPS